MAVAVKYLVAIDESKHAQWAFNYVVFIANKQIGEW
jgi:hypothetical protein